MSHFFEMVGMYSCVLIVARVIVWYGWTFLER